MTTPSIACPRCGAVSVHPKDIAERYCGRCHQFHEFMRHPFEPDHNGECLVCDNWADWPLHSVEFTAAQIAEMRAAVADGAGHECSEWRKGGTCQLCDRPRPETEAQ